MKVEVRDSKVVIEGYVNAVERESRLLPKSAASSKECRGPFIEKVATGTFQKALTRNTDIKMLFNHKADRLLGRTADGSLKLTEDNIGLKAEAEIEDEEVMTAALAGKLRGWSFGFFTNADEWADDKKRGCQLRTLKDIDMTEVSILTVTPAYIATSVEVRSEKGEEKTAEIRAEEEETEIRVIEREEKHPDEKIDLSLYRATMEILKLGGHE